MPVLSASDENPKKKNDKRYISTVYSDPRVVRISPPIPKSPAELALPSGINVSNPQVPHIYNDHDMLNNVLPLESMGSSLELLLSLPPAVSITKATPELSPSSHAAAPISINEAPRLCTHHIASSSSYQEFVFDSRSDHSSSQTSFHSVDPNPSRASGRRGPLSKLARVEMNAVKKMGACWRCKVLRKIVRQKRLKLKW
jgi:hypothetical protein